MIVFHDVASVADVPAGQARAFVVEDKVVGVFNCDGEILAINDICPHAGASLSAGYVEEKTVSCPWHAWRFNLCDGTWCDNPKLKVDSYPVKVESGRILVGLPSIEVTDGESYEAKE
jgi:nitrite reductase (NADH) small subunit/3-phenylpropionate/trans-cinnamate dioxygenase ferredoxin subunit